MRPLGDVGDVVWGRKGLSGKGCVDVVVGVMWVR